MLTAQTVKQPLKVLFWGMMSHRGLSGLNQAPRGLTAIANHYAREVLEKTTSTAMQRKKKKRANN